MTLFNVEEVRFWCRRDTAANWTSVNPVLSSGEWGVETDNTGSTPRKFKMGDGVTAWASLPYSHPGAFVVDSIADADTLRAPSRNAVFDALALKADKSGGTFTGDISVPDEAYDATAWNGSLEVPTKNAVRDKIEALGSGVSDGDKGDITVSGSGAAWTIDNAAVTLAKIANASASSKLLGSGASGSGAAYAELTLGTNLSMSGTTLNASGGSLGTSRGSVTAGSNVTSFSVSSLDLNTDKRWRIPFSIESNGTLCSVYLYFNADTTNANYRVQGFRATGATTAPFNSANGSFCNLQANETISGWIDIMLDRDGKPRAMCFTNDGDGDAGMVLWITSHMWTPAAANVTGITILVDVASQIKTGSTFEVLTN